ncbi:MAG: F0F1 ATP synthase subunit epsilon [Candidatus Omnitrophica bacterium]|nr:F0F1 ATP synthase subunit epsilon [Candidatus Omnitrophota bacterium]
MPNTFQFEILTPEKVFYSGTIASFIAPQMEGYFGVLAHHAPLLARSSGGKIKIRDESQTEHYFRVGPGIVEVLDNRAVFLTRQASQLEPTQV